MDPNNLHRLKEVLKEKNQEIRKLQKSMATILSAVRQTEETLAYYEDIVANIPSHLYWLDTNNIYLGCNDMHANAVGLKSRNDIVGKTNADMPWRDQAGTMDQMNKEIIQTGLPQILEESSVFNHVHRTFISHKVPLKGRNNKIIGVLGISTEITEIKELQNALFKAKEAAEAANHAKTEFIANMSHDIRTPLTGVVGMSELLEHSVQTAEQKQYAHWLYNSGNQLLTMLNGILEVVTADHVTEDDIKKDVFDLYQCIQDLIQLEQPTTELKRLGLKVNIDKLVPRYIISDRTKLHRILLNLLGNAIKFTKAGEITIEVKCLENTSSETHLQFSVRDTGIGIPKDSQDKVFDRFFRVTPSYKGIYEGYGVGLHIVQSYVTLLGGHITLTSQENVGTTFNFDLSCEIGNAIDAQSVEQDSLMTQPEPLIEPIVSSISTPATQSAIVDQNAPLCLVIEDNEIAMKILQSAVTKAGFRFESAMNAEHALELAMMHQFNLIIADVGLPGISGYEFTRRLRLWEVAEHKKPLPIVGLTGHAKNTAMQESIDAGMNDIFTKPITRAILNTIKNTYLHLPNNVKPVENINTTEKNIQHPLGMDLPNTEAELFLLDAYPWLDAQNALNNIGDENILGEILELMVTQEIPEYLATFTTFYAEKNWEAIEKLAHKIKGGAVYVGTVKLRYACQFLERYRKAGATTLLDKLYQQLIQIIRETKSHIEQWLKKK